MCLGQRKPKKKIVGNEKDLKEISVNNSGVILSSLLLKVWIFQSNY